MDIFSEPELIARTTPCAGHTHDSLFLTGMSFSSDDGPSQFNSFIGVCATCRGLVQVRPGDGVNVTVRRRSWFQHHLARAAEVSGEDTGPALAMVSSADETGPPRICREHELYEVTGMTFAECEDGSAWVEFEQGDLRFQRFTTLCVSCGGLRWVRPGDPVKLKMKMGHFADYIRSRKHPGAEGLIALVQEMVA